jgi:rhodanese-related sulfurtransferase
MVETLSTTEVAQLLAEADVVLIDVRDPHETAHGYIPGARLIPLDQLRSDPDAVLPHAGKLVFVCAKGIRSMTAAKLADRLGYTNVASLDGGTNAWAKAGLPLITDARAAA